MSSKNRSRGVYGAVVPYKIENQYETRPSSCKSSRVVEEERREAPDHHQGFLPLNWGETEQKRTFTYMVLKAKANDRRKF
ncbi:hypothetical protein TNCV_2442821 [Trichonephila clavipes]|nr:hypothetical protein TNCV_2442821 [Trichonephila clavipes]